MGKFKKHSGSRQADHLIVTDEISGVKKTTLKTASNLKIEKSKSEI